MRQLTDSQEISNYIEISKALSYVERATNGGYFFLGKLMTHASNVIRCKLDAKFGKEHDWRWYIAEAYSDTLLTAPTYNDERNLPSFDERIKSLIKHGLSNDVIPLWRAPYHLFTRFLEDSQSEIHTRHEEPTPMAKALFESAFALSKPLWNVYHDTQELHLHLISSDDSPKIPSDFKSNVTLESILEAHRTSVRHGLIKSEFGELSTELELGKALLGLVPPIAPTPNPRQ